MTTACETNVCECGQHLLVGYMCARCEAETEAHYINTHLEECADCGRLVIDPVYLDEDEEDQELFPEVIDTHWGTYCPDCVILCENCDDYAPPDRTHEVQEAIWCDRCKGRYAFRCTCCGELTPNDISVYTDDYGEVCENCAEEYFARCEGCGEIFHCDRISSDGYCPNCENDVPGRVHDYSFKPRPIFHGKGPLFYGIELEVEGVRDIEEIVEEEDYLYVKYDGSLNDGAEFVSHPASLEWIREQGKGWWERVWNLRHQDCQSWNTTTCGMHVHMSAKAFSSLHLYKLLKFFKDNPRFIAKISGRTEFKLDQWASVDTEKDIGIALKAKHKRGHSKYVALNCTGKTIECRIFRGTLKPQRFMANLEFLQAMYDFTSQAGLKDLTVERFKGFVMKHRKSYKVLWELNSNRF